MAVQVDRDGESALVLVLIEQRRRDRGSEPSVAATMSGAASTKMPPRPVPLIALTGYGQMRDKEHAAMAGFDADLSKPVVPEDLTAAIEAVVPGAAQAQGSGHPSRSMT